MTPQTPGSSQSNPGPQSASPLPAGSANRRTGSEQTGSRRPLAVKSGEDYRTQMISDRLTVSKCVFGKDVVYQQAPSSRLSVLDNAPSESSGFEVETPEASTSTARSSTEQSNKKKKLSRLSALLHSSLCKSGRSVVIKCGPEVEGRKLTRSVLSRSMGNELSTRKSSGIGDSETLKP